MARLTSGAERIRSVTESGGASDVDHLHMSPGFGNEGREIVRIRRNDGVSILRQENDGCVNHVTTSGPRKQRAGSAPKYAVERTDVDADESAGKQRLTRTTATPGLADDAAMRSQYIAGKLGSLETPPHGAVATFERDQCARIENEPHAAPRRRDLDFGREGPWTTLA
jgi:hypothetical protein